MAARFTFLGTGTSQGIPVIACDCEVCSSHNPLDKRLRTSGMLEAEGKTVVIDAGPDFRQQMLREQVKTLDAIVFTHPHKDHIAGLDDVRAFNFLLKREMDIYANKLTINALKREFAYIFEEKKYPGVPELAVHEILPYQHFQIGSLELLPIEVTHYKMPVLGFRYRDFAYITDASLIPGDSLLHLQGLDTLVLNALRIAPHISHFNLGQAISLIQRLKPRRAYLTHLSHLMGRHAEVATWLPPNIELAYDGLTLDL